MKTTRKLTIAVDIDGVIYDVIEHLVHTKLPFDKRRLRPSNWTCWDEMGITKTEFFNKYSQCWEEAGRDWTTAALYTDLYAKTLIKNLRRKGYRVSLITKRANRDIIHTIKYLELMRIGYDAFTVISDEEDKLKENFDIIIEDNPVNLPANLKQGGILINQKWNEYYEPKMLQVRVFTLQQAEIMVSSIAQNWLHRLSSS